MQIKNWRDQLKTLIPSHYKVTDSCYLSKIMRALPSDNHGDVILLKNSVNLNLPGFKTILISSCNSLNSSERALHWAANVRDILPEPYSSDIYLFLDIENASHEDCNRLEADELYCRKYVKRPKETTHDFIARTFLALPTSVEDLEQLSDPISASLSRVSEKHQWFSSEIKKAWRNALLSGKTPQEMVEELFARTLRD
ncbi:ABC-three component system middle component 1 [Pseudoalteromonas ruthenica]|uniref:ABC-three component system middle component 1 n=1 Tax=Pseudoalteromonas ruthenica TaxID=151081 RepID=UPI0006968952|nr:ABC-three component system middle component 1 [Pseudoalteromonas ruthenica]TMO91265.1 hypothetical protein CWC13_15645 [Pseudoalteromonas ruthenica]TMO97952.1 hypothetical protein CWC07_12835 [Pseudoalteromonas ruthenica]TMP06845.1 hypothetical protein CWC09_10770 [Pseudoalteromonas ruthenica]TMP08867.1 hypothetical protein CWC08_10800 [Pseudoalteromonas ruthenica]